jgi:hypothetical protein
MKLECAVGKDTWNTGVPMLKILVCISHKPSWLHYDNQVVNAVCNCLMFIPCISDVLEEKTNNLHWLYHYFIFLFLCVVSYMFRQ